MDSRELDLRLSFIEEKVTKINLATEKLLNDLINKDSDLDKPKNTVKLKDEN